MKRKKGDLYKRIDGGSIGCMYEGSILEYVGEVDRIGGYFKVIKTGMTWYSHYTNVKRIEIKPKGRR